MAEPDTQEMTTTPADGTAPQAAPSGGMENLFTIIVIWVVVLYFFFYRPQKRKERDRRDKLQSVKKGDHVVTVGGVHGRVVQISETSMVLEVDKKTGATIKFSRQAMMEVAGENGPAKVQDNNPVEN